MKCMAKLKRIILFVFAAFGVLAVIGILGLVSLSMNSARHSSRAPSLFGEVALEAPMAPEFEIPKWREIIFESEKSLNSTPSETPSRLVIKTGSLNIVVEDVRDSAKKIIQYAEGKKGWVVSSSITEREKIPSGTIQVRVPAEIFDEAMVYFATLAKKVTHEGIRGQDVTEEYTDLQSQLRNLEATETQLLKIMERSGTITEVLAVQKELTNVRGQIEQTKGRMQYLEQSVKMSTITINLALSEELLPIPPAEKWRPVYVIKRSWHSLLGSLRGISYFLIWIGIYAIIWVPLGVIIWLGRRFWKKRKSKAGVV